MSSECIVVVVSVIKSACPGLLLPSTCHFQRKRFSSSEYFCYQLHSQLSSPFRLHSTCCAELNLFFIILSQPTSSALSALSRRWIFQKAIFFHFLWRRKLFALNSWFIQHWLVCCSVLLSLWSPFSANTKNCQQRGKAEENFNVFPTNTGATFWRAEILFAAACFFLPFQIVNRFFSGENLICLFRHYSVYFSPHRSARLEFDSITQN